MRRRSGRWAMWVMLLALVAMVVPVLPRTASAETIVYVDLQSAGNNIGVGDIQSKFPGVGWTNPNNRIIVRIPAGQYGTFSLNNLPDRRGMSPVTITNYGGQVKIGQPNLPKGSRNDNAILISGGANWILTGEYNPAKQTGHPNFKGHQDGNYANSRGNYGIEVAYTKDSAVKIGGGATDFEVSFMEVAQAGFAGFLVKTGNNPNSHMSNVKLHDLYVHDTDSEGLYIGQTEDIAQNQHKFINLQIYNNRIVRTGSEGIQVSHIADGSRVYNNVVAMSAQSWKSPFQASQDFAIQVVARYGQIEIDHNIVIGAAGNLFNARFVGTAAERNGPAGKLRVHDNYFSHSRSVFSYQIEQRGTNPLEGINNDNKNSELWLENNYIQNVRFHHGEALIGAEDRHRLIDINQNVVNPIAIKNNKFEPIDAAQRFILDYADPNPNTAVITASGNQETTVADVKFMDSFYTPSFDYFRAERWFPELTNGDEPIHKSVKGKYNEDIYYEAGDYVEREGKMYKALTDHKGTTATPGSSPSVWQQIPMPADDFRLQPDSPYQGMGLLDNSDDGNDGGDDGDGGDGGECEAPTLQLIVPAGADTAVGSQYFPMGYAFEGTVTYNAAAGEPSGGSGGNYAPYYPDRYGYIDFGPNWAHVRIVETWTKYRESSSGNSTPYAALWWDDDKDTVNDSGLNETGINFNTRQNLNTGWDEPWYRDRNFSANPVTPKAQYLIMKSPSNMTQRALEYAIIGYVDNGSGGECEEGGGEGGNGGGGQPTLQLIVPAGADTAVGSQYFPMGYAFEGTVTYNAAVGEPSGGSGGNYAPYYPDRYGYIDFGPNWAHVRIVETWTKYRESSSGNSTPYAALWWDDDKDTVNDSGLNETGINFNTRQNLNTGWDEPWYRDWNFSANPVTPKAQYLIMKSPSNMTQRALEYAIIGWIEN